VDGADGRLLALSKRRKGEGGGISVLMIRSFGGWFPLVSAHRGAFPIPLRLGLVQSGDAVVSRSHAPG
jgi:hypothetical protein